MEIKIFKELFKKLSTTDLDDYVHDIKSQEATNINNAGLHAQLVYLETTRGLDWLIDTFLK